MMIRSSYTYVRSDNISKLHIDYYELYARGWARDLSNRANAVIPNNNNNNHCNTANRLPKIAITISLYDSFLLLFRFFLFSYTPPPERRRILGQRCTGWLAGCCIAVSTTAPLSLSPLQPKIGPTSLYGPS